MKKLFVLLAAVCLLVTGCGKKEAAKSEPAQESQQTQETQAVTVTPLPDTTMENLTDAILSVSLEEGGAYVDDTGKMQMDLKIYSYDKYDMVDIANLQVGDVIVTHAGEVKVTALDKLESGLIFVNGGQEEGGFDLFTDESGIYFEHGFNDAKNWYQVGEATIRVSADFAGVDSVDPDKGDVALYPGSFLVGEVTNYDFTPYNTTIRVEGGQIVEMTRTFAP